MKYKNQKYLTLEFIQKAKAKHGNMYDYSKVEYITCKTKIKIKCKIHGEFKQTARSHLRGSGCPKCAIEKLQHKHKRKFTTELFIKRASVVHDDIYDYSKVEYKTARLKVCIICKTHGEFWQSPDAHIHGKGCCKCGHVKTCSHTCSNTENFIKRARLIHDDIYDYSKVEYIRSASKVCIICKIHGEFSQIANSHLNGAGCPECNSSKGELKIMKFLNNENIDFKHEHSFEDCISPNRNLLRFDFYLPKYNMCIEYDGEFHFHKFNHISTSHFEKVNIYDNIKNDYCKQNKIKLLRISYIDFDNVERIILNTIIQMIVSKKWTSHVLVAHVKSDKQKENKNGR